MRLSALAEEKIEQLVTILRVTMLFRGINPFSVFPL